MKLGFISDIHLDVNNAILAGFEIDYSVDQMVEDIKEEIKRLELSYLFISGDIMNTERTKDIIQELNTVGVEVYYVVGNHDVWSMSLPTREVLNLYKEDERCLVGKTLDVGKYVIVGMFSWYDGTFDTMGKSVEYYESNKVMWADSRFTQWEEKNDELTDEFIIEAKKLIQKVDKDIILLNHFVPHQDFIVHRLGDDGWNFGNGYMGSKKLQEMIKKEDKIKYVSFGHTHSQFGKVEKDGKVFIGNPVGYVHEWDTRCFKERFTGSLEVIEI